jgi:2'-hydroxyisoflavone reductase
VQLLILGGTDFVGRHMVESALAQGHDVTIFNRGQTNPELFPSVERRLGDRTRSDLASLEEGEWDGVIDLTGTLPDAVGRMAEMMVGRVGVYVFLSLSSVYRDLDSSHVDEDAPLKVVEEPVSDAVNASTYGGLKVLSEGVVRRHFPQSHLIVRAGTMTGPYDNTDRFTYWVRRMARGLPVLAPSRPEQPIQLLHARDHADFVVRSVAASRTGVFNVVGPDQPTTFADMLQACADAAGTTSRTVWAPQPFLDARKVRFPLELLAADNSDGIYRLANDRARAAGLVNRPLTDTASEVLEWDRARGQPRLRVVRGLAPPREANLLAQLTGGAAAPRTDQNNRPARNENLPSRIVRRTPVSPLGLEVARDEAGATPAGRIAALPRASCLIATTPRTGSWLLADLLAATGLVGPAQEFFRRDFVRTFSGKLGLPDNDITAEYIGGIFASAPPETGVFGVKLQPNDFTRLRTALRTMTAEAGEGEMTTAELISRWLPNPRYIHLSRRDVGRQALSWYRALSSNVWWEFEGESPQLAPPRYPDFLQVRWLENLIRQNEVEWAEYFDQHGITPCEVVYEDMVENPAATVAAVLSFLSLEASPERASASTKLKRMADEDSEAWYEAYNVVRDSLPAAPKDWYWSVEQVAFVPPAQV